MAGSLNPEKSIQDRVRILDVTGISQGLRATDFKDPVKIVSSDTHSPNRLFNIYGEDRGTGYAGNVWDKENISPTLTTMRGGVQTTNDYTSRSN